MITWYCHTYCFIAPLSRTCKENVETHTSNQLQQVERNIDKKKSGVGKKMFLYFHSFWHV